ncbi:MAG TPA: UDP-N-acetylglucosamine 2-epimerase (non-hydrolyzing) [Solirubrobacteraceae bacterium]|jgi:UDP-N-acetylglucosamine 2-epimerase (non-hydrolysing)/UDP-GlcNAc3NAcA epimerase
MRVATVVGNRPQFVKAAAVSPPLRERHEEILIHTGQHHDEELSSVFFEELGLPRPDHSLEIAGGSNSSQLGRMLAELAPLLASIEPDVVLVYGDTNSTLAGALAAADGDLPLVHVEAGMRSFDRTQPEERNRVLADQLSALLLCSSAQAAAQLQSEGVPGQTVLVGDVMVDVALTLRERALARTDVPARYGVEPGSYVLATAHRPANVDDPAALERLVVVLEAIAEPVIMPLHPRTLARLERHHLDARAAAAASLTPPLGYLEFAALLHNARAVLTDSGGVQKEAYLAGVPCVTLRERTEWDDTVAAGWNTLVSLDAQAAVAALERTPPPERPPLWGEGDAGRRIVAALEAYAAA